MNDESESALAHHPSLLTRHSTTPMVAFTNIFFAALLGFICAPAHALDTQRPDVQKFIGDMVSKHQLKRNELRALLRDAQSKPAIIEAMTRPAEQVFPWYEYRERFITDRRINKGVAFWNQQDKQLQ